MRDYHTRLVYIAHALIIVCYSFGSKDCRHVMMFTRCTTLALHSERTLLGGIVRANGKTPERLLTERDTKWPLPPRGQV